MKGRLTLLLCLLSLAMSAQQLRFKYTYGGTSYDYGRSAKQTLDTGYIAAGSTSSFGNGTMDMMLVRTDSMGKQRWVRTYGGSNVEWGYDVEQTKDTGFAIAGYTNSFGAGGYDFYLVKTDTAGNQQWAKTYGGADWDFAYSMEQTSDGGYILAGGTYSTVGGDEDVYLVKTNSIGDTLWTRKYGGPMQDEAHSVKQTSDGGYILTGFSKTSNDTLGNVYVIKTDAGGDTVWTRKYGGAKADFGNDVIESTSLSAYVIGGGTNSFGLPDLDFYLLQLQLNGDTVWTRKYKPTGGNGDDVINGVCAAKFNTFAFTGYNYSNSAGFNDIFFFKFDQWGYYIDATSYGTFQHEDGFSIENTMDNGFILCGFTDSTQTGFGLPNLLLIKTDSLGSTAKKFQVGLNEQIKGDVVGSIYPNPVKGSAEFALSGLAGRNSIETGSVKMAVFNSIGADVSNALTITDITNTPDALRIRFNRAEMAPGIYFVSIWHENCILGTGKFIIND